MFYAPHKLQKRVITPPDKDEYGRPIPGTEREDWVDVCKCHCNDNYTTKFQDANGEVFIPSYKIVCPLIKIKVGDYVRCLEGEEIRGEGEVYRVSKLDYIRYLEIWV